MGNQRAIKKALMKGKGYPTKHTEFLSHSGKVYGTREVSTVGWYKLISTGAGRVKK